MLSRSAASPPLRIAILGAGPIGLEAALYGRCLGHDVVLFEQGDVAHAVQSWRHVRMFSPWSWNHTPLGCQLLLQAGYPLPDEAQEPTGQEFLEHYLWPLSRDPLLAGRIRQSSRVVQIGRDGLLKGDMVGHAGRGRHPFRLLIEARTGEHVEHADVVLDCTGTFGCPNAIGDGGIPAPGERWLEERLVRHVPDVLGRDRKRFADRRVLVAGGGMSAAATVCALSRLCAESPGTEVTWAVRREGLLPYRLPDREARSAAVIDREARSAAVIDREARSAAVIDREARSAAVIDREARSAAVIDREARSAALIDREAASLPGLVQLMCEANELARAAADARRPLRFLHGTHVDAMSAEGHRLRVRLRTAGGHFKDELWDEVVGLTGYGPDNSLYRELQIDECYATRAPGRKPNRHPDATDTLRHPEPGFFIIGQKSVGKQSMFLLRSGHEQVRGVYQLLHDSPGLDLYTAAPATEGPAAFSVTGPGADAAAAALSR